MQEEQKGPSMEDFQKWFEKQTGKGKDPLTTLGNFDFKARFNVGKASVLKCPACPALGELPGTLYPVNEEPGYFVCRKCHEKYFIQVPNRPGGLDDLIDEIKAIRKDREDRYEELKKKEA